MTSIASGPSGSQIFGGGIKARPSSNVPHIKFLHTLAKFIPAASCSLDLLEKSVLEGV
jgi:hypothetical protein